MESIVFNIRKNDIVSIVGAGGKTSLLFYLANQLIGKKLLSTSTKIEIPKNYRIELNREIFFEKDNELLVTAYESFENKLCGINEWAVKSDFDYYLIEADGSKRKPIKGWNKTDPVIIEESNVTIGLVDITVVNKVANENLIFRIEEFRKITNLEEKINVDNLIDMITNENGLFKDSKHKLILYINKVEDNETLNNTRLLVNKLKKHDFYHRIDQIVYGSIKENKMFVYEDLI